MTSYRARGWLTGVRHASAVMALSLSLFACWEEGGSVPTVGVTIRGISQGATLTGVIDIGADVDGARADSIDVYVGGKRVARATTQPLSVALDTRQFSDAPVKVAVVVLADAADYPSEFAVTIDNTPPALTLTSPASPLVYTDGDDLAVALDVKDVSGVTQLSVKANGVPVPVQGPPYVAKVSLASLGRSIADLPLAVTLEVRAVDKASLVTTKVFPLSLRSRVAWKFPTLGEIWAPPAFGANGTAYFGSRDGKLYSVSPTGVAVGAPVTIGGEILYTPVVDTSGGTDRVWLAAGDSVVSVDPSGKQATLTWTATSTVGTAPVVGASTVFVGTFAGELVGLDRKTLAKRWSVAMPAPVESTPVLLDGDVAVFGCDDHFIHAVDVSGVERWKIETGGNVWSRPTKTRNGDVLVGSHDGYLYRLNASGTKLWEFEARGQLWGAATESPSGTIYVGSTYATLYALSPEGKSSWRHDLGGLAFVTPAISRSGRVYVGAANGTVYALSPTGEIVWSFATGAEIVGAAVLSPDQSMVLVGGKDRHMTALNTGEP